MLIGARHAEVGGWHSAVVCLRSLGLREVATIFCSVLSQNVFDSIFLLSLLITMSAATRTTPLPTCRLQAGGPLCTASRRETRRTARRVPRCSAEACRSATHRGTPSSDAGRRGHPQSEPCDRATARSSRQAQQPPPEGSSGTTHARSADAAR